MAQEFLAGKLGIANMFHHSQLIKAPKEAVMRRQFLYIFSTLILSIPAFAMADTAAIMEGCDGCHGDDGVSQWSDMPTIAGLAGFYHADALYAYQDEARPCAESDYRQGDTSRAATTMCAVAAELSEDDLDAIAEAYAAFPYVTATQEFEASLVEAGKALHDEACDRCHSEGGTNPEDEAGMLGGQQMGYMRDTFAQFADGSREQPKKMKEKMDSLSAEDTQALINYYCSIQ